MQSFLFFVKREKKLSTLEMRDYSSIPFLNSLKISQNNALLTHSFSLIAKNNDNISGYVITFFTFFGCKRKINIPDFQKRFEFGSIIRSYS